MPSIWNQTMIAVGDVERSSRWYVDVIGLRSAHGGADYDQLVDEAGEIVVQLHRLGTHDHPSDMGDPAQPLGNGVALWFEVADFGATVERVRSAGATVEIEPQENPLAKQQEIWLTDPDGYRVVIAGPSEFRPR